MSPPKGEKEHQAKEHAGGVVLIAPLGAHAAGQLGGEIRQGGVHGAPDGQGDDEDHEANAVAVKGIVEDLLAKMAIEANVNVSVSEPDSVTGKRFLAVDIDGENVSALIGPRGEALNALQYVLRLMSGHQLRRRVNILLDVANYRERRRQALSRMATRMAEKVTSKDRPVTLEPMPPFERRVIHMTLRDDAEVYTQSIGNGDRRRVRIYPKRN